MKAEAIHLRRLTLGGGVARTFCGLLVPEAETTADWREVTCQGRGCEAERDERFEARKVGRKAWSGTS